MCSERPQALQRLQVFGFNDQSQSAGDNAWPEYAVAIADFFGDRNFSCRKFSAIPRTYKSISKRKKNLTVDLHIYDFTRGHNNYALHFSKLLDGKNLRTQR